MSISFSGLASGLDTSSWVESLVKLKQAKITTLEEQKENVLLSKETLNNIKAFFSSFRSMIEKITDTKFGVASMDLFAQNLATSSNLSILTASATTEAEEATYNVLVDKLATETNALSNYNYLTTIIQTTTATNDSKLIHLGVNAGNIGVTINGIERGINITENDTIATFIEKLREIGAEASYNEQTGVFSVNVDDGAINDIDGTGIVDALHLRGVNEGYTSESLKTSTTDTVYSAATESTLLKDLGVLAGVVGIEANDTSYNITITNSTTLGDFINSLKSQNIDATLDATGVFTLSDAEIVSEGTTNILTALGLEVDIYDKSQATGNLSYQTVVTQTTTATSDTLLKDLGEGITVNNNSTVIVKNSNNDLTTITIGATSTVGDLLGAMKSAGLNALINSNGNVEISGGTIVGGSFDAKSALGLEESPYTAIVNGDPLTETIETKENVTLQTRLVEDLNVKKGYLEVTDSDNNKQYLKIYSGQTISDLKSDLIGYGLSCDLDESSGILTIAGGSFKALSDSEVANLVSSGKINETDAEYQKGTDLLEHLYGSGTISTDKITVDSAYAKSQALNHTVTNTVKASSTTTLEKLGLSTNGTAIFDVNGEKHTINVSKTTTMQELVEMLNNNGISASWDNESSKLSIENASLSGGTSNLASVLNLTETVYGKYTTSDSLYRQVTTTVDATRDTTLKDFGISNSMSASERTVTLYNSDGTQAGTTVVTEATTIGDLIDFINNKSGISASIEDGVFQINNGYISNSALEASMGLTSSNKSSYVLGSVIMTTTLAAVTGESKIGDIISAMGTTSEVAGGYDLSFDGKSIAVSADTTLNDVINAIYANGGVASLDSTGRLSVTGGLLEGSVAEAFGITSNTKVSSITSSGEAIFTSKDVYADQDTKFGDLGITNSSYTIRNSANGVIQTVNVDENTTIGSFFETLKANGIDGTISNGVITLASETGNYVDGDLADSLGILTRTTTTVVNTTQSSTVGITNTETVLADLTTTLGQIGAISLASDDIKVYDSSQKCIGTISNLTTSSTIEDMFNALKTYGIRGSISNGVISLSAANGNYAGGKIMENINISPELLSSSSTTIAMSVSSKDPLMTSVTTSATSATTMGQLLYLSEGETETLKISNTKSGAAIADIVVNDSTTIEQFFDQLNAYGIEGSIENGVISLKHSQNITLGGVVATRLDLTNVKTFTMGLSTTSTGSVTYTTTVHAQGTDGIFDFVNWQPTIFPDTTLDSYGQVTGAGTIVAVSTADDLRAIARGGTGYEGYKFVLTNNITLTDSNWEGIKNFAGEFDGQGYSIKLDISGQGNGEFGLFSSIEGGTVKNLSVYGEVRVQANTSTYVGGIAGSLRGGGSILSSTTSVRFVGDNITAGGIAGYGNSGDIKNCVVSGMSYSSSSIVVGGTVGMYSSSMNISDNIILDCDVNGSEFYAIGHAVSPGGTCHVSNTLWTNSDWKGVAGDWNTEMSGYNCTIVSTSTLISTTGISGSYVGNSVYVYDMNFKQIGSIDVNENTTFNQFISSLSDYGIEATLNDGTLSLTSTNGNFVAGALVDALGINEKMSSPNGIAQTSSGAILATVNVTATMSSTVSNFGSGTRLYVNDKTNTRKGTIVVSSTTTFQDLADKLATYDIQLSIDSDGIISVYSYGNNTVSGTLANNLGLRQNSNTVLIDSTNEGITVVRTEVVSSTDGTLVIDGTISSSGVTGNIIGISTAQDLQNLATLVNNGNGMAGKTFVLMNDIDLSGTFFTPIGYDNHQFKGTFDGANHKISNLNVELNSSSKANGSSPTRTAGLFGAISGATIKNLTISDASITSALESDSVVLDIGVVAGLAYDSTISGVNVTNLLVAIGTLGTSSTAANIGGIIGFSSGATTIRECQTSGNTMATVERSGISVGGILGQLSNNILIEQCSAELKVNGSYNNVGGIVGVGYGSNNILRNNRVHNTYTLSTYTASYTVGGIGGLIGRAHNGASVTMENNFIDLSGVEYYSTNNTAGLAVGYVTDDSKVKFVDNCILFSGAGSGNYLATSGIELANASSSTCVDTTQGTTYQSSSMNDAKNWMSSNFSSSAWTPVYTTNVMDPVVNKTTYRTDLYGEQYYNDTGTLVRSKSQNITESTNINDIVNINNVIATDKDHIKLIVQGTEQDLDLSDFQTVGDLLEAFNFFGINATVNNGRINISDSSNAYIKAIDSELSSILKINAGEGISYKYGVANNSSQFSEAEDHTLNLDTTLSDLGITSKAYIDYEEYDNYSNVVSKYVAVSPDETIADLISKLDAAGISASIKDGKFTITPKDSNNIHIVDITSSLANALKIKAGENITYECIDTYKSNYREVIIRDGSLTLDSQIKDIGPGSFWNKSANITIVQNGTERLISVAPETTVAEMFTALSRYGIDGYINNGKIELDCNGTSYIKGMSNGLDSHLGLTVGENSSYTVRVGNTYANTDSDKLEYVNNAAKITGNTQFSDVSGYSDGNGQIAIHKANGEMVTININGTDTLNDFFRRVSAYGISGSVDSNGKVIFQGSGDAYLESVAGGSNFLDIFKVSEASKNTNVSTSNTASNTLKYSQKVAASSGTTLENLADISGNNIVFDASGKASLILSKTTKSGTSQVTLEFSKTSSLDDVIDELAKQGIAASVDSRGRFSVSTNSLDDFDISGTLGSFLMGSYTKDYDITSITNVSSSLFDKKVLKMNDATKLSDLGITNGNIEITKDGVTSTVNIDLNSLETVGDFRDFLSFHGFTTTLYNQGRMSVSGNGNSSLASVSGGSNILDVLGLTDWSMSDVSQSSGHLDNDTVKVESISMTNKLSELTDASGTNLGITSGQISVYHNGTRNTLNIDANETLDSLANKLSRYGISVNLSSDGKLYFNGTNDSYLSLDGISAGSASNILSKIGINGDWVSSGKSVSSKLEYEEQVVEAIDRNTKLKDLKDASGNSIGITNGAFYVYSNGVRNTETIDNNMSVGDFISLMDTYGIKAEILTDGSISLSSSGNSYLASSSLAGENSNIVSKLFNNYEFMKSYASDKLEITKSQTKAITRDTKLSDINEGTFEDGYITVVKDGVNTNVSFSSDDTVGTFIDKLALYGFNTVINGNGQLVMNSTGNSELANYTGAGKASNILNILGVNEANWIKTNRYESDSLGVVNKSTVEASATRDTLLSELGVSTGEYYVYNNGVKFTALISSDETLGSFMDTLKSFGLETSLVQGADGSLLSVVGKGDSYIAKSASVNNASNVVDKLFAGGVSTSYDYSGLQQTSEVVTTYSAATEDTLLSYFDNGLLKSEGDLSVSVNGVENTIKIASDETFGSLIEKFKALGVEATLTNGQLMIQSGYDAFTINTDGTTSNLQASIKLVYSNDLGGYVASDNTVLATTSTVEEKTLSVSNYADYSTKIGKLNISDGALTVYRNGQKATIQIDSDETFGDLRTKLSTAFADLDLKFEDGYLTIYSKDGNNVEVGSTTDTTNFLAITGITSDGSDVAKSARELYRVNSDSVITDSGLFRKEDVTEGTFIVGNETFTIDDKTTLADIISQINSSEKANATAYWDNIKGRLVIKSRSTGAAYVNIEAGTSNFTDVMGFTTSEWEADGKLKVTRMNINNQEVGQNARISINGTNYTSTSNTITSDVSRIKGLTINLKGLTDGSAVTLTVERDKETLANAISDVVDSYNELMKNVDEAISKEGKLNRETTLKMIRNNLRNLMTSSDSGTTVFRNLSAIGISTSSASANNIATSNESVINLAFDKEKFIKAYEADADALKALLVGGENNKGVFTKVEELVESTLQSVNGYFASTDNSFTKKAENIERKIVNGTKEIERYRARLEAKFSSMDMLIANMQQQYSSFLTT